MTPAEIKQLRLRLGLSQQAFADKLGVSVHSISRWETGETTPRGLQARELDRVAKRGALR